ncbi:hypothetical protein PLICRDRAFT_107529 [Plicaturopsis crispa FD-325 SS-3]|nr:hypothetical protein PLICRDRAFT_107529 [Plicaturopsis crispa FD-325 SS-3]
MLKPVDMEWAAPDGDTPKVVRLLVYTRTIQGLPPTPHRERHWGVTWHIEPTRNAPVLHRIIHLVQEPGRDHFTNWGPITNVPGSETYTLNRVVPIATLTLPQRQQLERLSREATVYKANGDWNCQDWIVDILRSAVDHGLISHLDVDRVLQAAST